MALAKEQIKLAFEQSEKVADLHQGTRRGLFDSPAGNGKSRLAVREGTGFETKKSQRSQTRSSAPTRPLAALDDAECMKLTGLARNTYYKYKRQIRAKLL